MTLRLRFAALLLPVLAAAAGCEHSRPAEPGDPEPAPPLTGSPPLRITYNPEDEWNPVYTQDGTGILYSFAVPGRADRDRCLGLLPAAGGTMQGELCWRGPGEGDSADVVVTGAESPGGRLAFVAERSRSSSFFPSARALLAGPPRDPENAAVILPFPFSHSNVLWHGARDLTWLDDSTLVFVAELYGYNQGGSSGPPDTLRTGIEVVRLDLRTDPATIRSYGVTRWASSVALGPGPGTVIFTVGGDARVFTLDLATGAAALLHDFGALGIARDARLVNGTLVAVVGGYVTYAFDSPHAREVQRDLGGPIYAVDLAGAAAPILLTAATDAYRHLSLAPSGATVAAERYPVTEIEPGTFVVGAQADIYLVPLF